MTIEGLRAAPTIDELVERARGMLPKLRGRETETERLRRLPEATVADLQQAGLFRVFQPARYGGFELDYGATQIDLCNELGRASGSAAWVQSVVACHAWLIGMYPLEAQEAVWGDDGETIVASAFGATTGRGWRTDGGYTLEGDWEFSSGVHACQWILLAVRLPENEQNKSGAPRVLFCLLPKSDYEILDTWSASGLRGSGSHGVRVANAFVPDEFILDTGLGEAQRPPGIAVNAGYIYRLPLWTVFGYNLAAPAIGTARGGLEAYVEMTRERPERAGEPARQMRIAESSVEIDCAEALLRADAAELKRLVQAGTPPSPEFRARCGRDLGYAGLLCARAMDRLMASVGAHGLDESSAIARARADVYAALNHHGLSWDARATSYGSVALGQAPPVRSR